MEKFLGGNLSSHISETEGHRKLKFREVGLQICQNVLTENRAKKLPT